MTIGSFLPIVFWWILYIVKKLTVERIDEMQNLLNDVFSQKCSIIDTLLENLDMIRKKHIENRKKVFKENAFKDSTTGEITK